MGLYNRQTGRLGVVRQLQKAALGPWYDSTLTVAGNFDISNIPQGYTTIEYLLSDVLGDVTALTDNFALYFNGDTTATNYRRVRHRYTDAAHDQSTVDSPVTAVFPAASAVSNYVGTSYGFIFSYSGSNNKNYYVRAIERSEASGDIQVVESYIQWENTAAITQVTIQPDGYSTDKFDVGTRLQIWLRR